MSDYKIIRVSDKPPRSWSFKGAGGSEVLMETYRVMVEGQREPIEVNKKPGMKPSVGEQLTGSIIESQYGLRFKPDKKPFSPNGRDSAEIKAEWAIGQAVAVYVNGKDEDINDVEKNAKDFFIMVDRVKQSGSSGYAQFQEAGRNIGKTDIEEVFEVADDKINLDDIPF